MRYVPAAGGRRILSILTALLFVAGVGMFLCPFITDVYTDEVLQRRLEGQFTGQFSTDLGIGDLGVDDWEATVAPGRALTRAVPVV